MKKITVYGGRPLVGTLTAQGSKNAALPILFSTLITGGVSQISGVPDIGDVSVATKILTAFGADIERFGDTLTVDTRYVRYTDPDATLVSRIRASTYLIGTTLARFGIARIRAFGGCNFSGRPIDIHLDACRMLGATVNEDVIVSDRLRGGEIVLRLPSVGATVNSLIMAVAAEGKSVIKNYAKEPHIDELIAFLRSAGANIAVTEKEITVTPTPLHGGTHRISADMIEIGSYLVLAAATDGRITVTNPPRGCLSSIISALENIGVTVREDSDTVTAERGAFLRNASIVAEPYPGFPTDLAPIFAPLLSIVGGSITDNVWQSRFGYLDELRRFGISSSLVKNRATVYSSALRPATVTAPDLRGGMACVITALMTEGRSEIHSAETVLRGYERLEEKLASLGADVRIT